MKNRYSAFSTCEVTKLCFKYTGLPLLTNFTFVSVFYRCATIYRLSATHVYYLVNSVGWEPGHTLSPAHTQGEGITKMQEYYKVRISEEHLWNLPATTFLQGTSPWNFSLCTTYSVPLGLRMPFASAWNVLLQLPPQDTDQSPLSGDAILYLWLKFQHQITRNQR